MESPKRGHWTQSTFLIGLLYGVALGGAIVHFSPFTQEADVDHYREVRDFIHERYVEDIDSDVLVRSALSGMVESLDPYSRYLSTSEETSTFDRETRGSFTGIGVVFRGPIEGGRVLFPMSNSPAADAGVRVGDQIITVDGAPLAGTSETQARALFQGAAGSVATLTLSGLDGEERSVAITRRSLLDPTVRHPHMVDVELKIAYLALTSFSRETAQEFARTIEALADNGMQGLILDLRGNPGGVLVCAVDMARTFIDEGVITRTRSRGEPIVYERHAEDGVESTDLPLVILVDGGSASSSEVLAGALQDHRAAVLVGSPTYGKARVQSVRHFDDAGAIVKVTSSYYTTPSGRDLERSPLRPWGIQPDLHIALDAKTEALVHRHIHRYDPPAEALEALFAWEDASGEELLPQGPEDPQLAAALALLRGERPAGS
jgi:carboxyl-terminal processing protease